MAVTYTNRKGHTYYLCQGLTKTGKLRYYFARKPKEGSPDQLPEGYKISESVNGIVSLVKDRPQLILPQEIESVEAVLARHPKGRDYRVAVQKNQIVIYERLGPDIDTLSVIFGKISAFQSDAMKARLQEQLDKMARFSPVLRFILIDPEERKFTAERWSYMGDINDWIDIGESGNIDNLARRQIPKLGTDDFCELF
ncbi:MAG: hypothetical protein B6D39_00090 [Anaerolineae bacterium UTCFX2]|jgi:hypothetical protein|nr:hypothetical protein [Anaerolineales bacterium]OQY95330.1 MAG: hypothetical protein B6D39_00090 [Anaerolineae bacterium UTCFX2]